MTDVPWRCHVERAPGVFCRGAGEEPTMELAATAWRKHYDLIHVLRSHVTPLPRYGPTRGYAGNVRSG